MSYLFIIFEKDRFPKDITEEEKNNHNSAVVDKQRMPLKCYKLYLRLLTVYMVAAMSSCPWSSLQGEEEEEWALREKIKRRREKIGERVLKHTVVMKNDLKRRYNASRGR